MFVVNIIQVAFHGQAVRSHLYLMSFCISIGIIFLSYTAILGLWLHDKSNWDLIPSRAFKGFRAWLYSVGILSFLLSLASFLVIRFWQPFEALQMALALEIIHLICAFLFIALPICYFERHVIRKHPDFSRRRNTPPVGVTARSNAEDYALRELHSQPGQGQTTIAVASSAQSSIYGLADAREQGAPQVDVSGHHLPSIHGTAANTRPDDIQAPNIDNPNRPGYRTHEYYSSATESRHHQYGPPSRSFRVDKADIGRSTNF